MTILSLNLRIGKVLVQGQNGKLFRKKRFVYTTHTSLKSQCHKRFNNKSTHQHDNFITFSHEYKNSHFFYFGPLQELKNTYPLPTSIAHQLITDTNAYHITQSSHESFIHNFKDPRIHICTYRKKHNINININFTGITICILRDEVFLHFFIFG